MLQALLAKDLDDEMHGEPTQVRVTQGKEPDHFCLLFRGRMVVHTGGVDSAYVCPLHRRPRPFFDTVNPLITASPEASLPVSRFLDACF
jgi:hypothetical protein